MESPDFEDIAESIAAFQPPAGQPPARVTGTASVETLQDLVHELSYRAVEPEKCAFYINPGVWESIWHEADMLAHGVSVDQALGRPVFAKPTMPEHTILFMAPDAVTLGGTVVNPLAVAFAELTTDA